MAATGCGGVGTGGAGVIAGVSGACRGTVMTGGGDGRRACDLGGAASRSGGRNATFGSGGGGGEGRLPGRRRLWHQLDGERAAGVALVALPTASGCACAADNSTAPAHGRAATPRMPPGSRRFLRRHVFRPAGGARISSATQRGTGTWNLVMRIGMGGHRQGLSERQGRRMLQENILLRIAGPSGERELH